MSITEECPQNTFTVEELIKKVRELAGQYPEAVYQRYDGQCLYNYGDVLNGPQTKGCLFGQAIKMLLPNTELNHQCSICGLLSLLDVDFRHYGTWLTRCQTGQDNGATWSCTVRNADLYSPIDI